MKTLPDFLDNPVTSALGWTLVHALWQGVALVLPAAVVLYGLRSQLSALRYRVGVLALLAQLTLSIATFAWYYSSALAPILPVGLSAASLMPAGGGPTVAQALPWYGPVQYVLNKHLSLFVLVYLIGVVGFALRLLGGWAYVQRLSRTAVSPASAVWAERIGQLRVTMNVRPLVRVRESARVAVPMVVGVLKPVLLLPIGLAAHLSVQEVEAVLAHELAHIKRHDYAVNLLQSVVEVLYFFHPALWWLSARVREEREHCCDDLAVRACGGDGRTLAQALARVEERRLEQLGTPALAMAFTTSRQQLLHRVRRVLGVPTRPVISNGSLAGLTLATLLLVSASVFAMRQRQDKPQPRVRTTQPRPTRRHTIDSHSEYGMADNQRISYVVWKGQKLPASYVAKLQRQLDQVMAGQLNLDSVNQPDRDVLLTIIEKNVAFDAGMKALSEGLAHIDYNNIVVNAHKTLPGSPDSTEQELAKTNRYRVLDGDIVTSSSLQLPADSLKRTVAQHRLDSLMAAMKTVMDGRKEAIDQISKEMANLTLKGQDFQKQLAPIHAQAGLMGQQARLLAQIAQLSMRTDAQSRKVLQQKEKEMARMEKTMSQFEKQVQQQQKQIEASSAYTDRLSVLADSISRLYEPITTISEQIGELSTEIAEDAMRQAKEAMRLVDKVDLNLDPKINAPHRPARPHPAPRPPRPLKEGLVPPKPPRVIQGRVVRPKALVAPVAPVQPRPVLDVAPMPKPVVAPVPAKP